MIIKMRFLICAIFWIGITGYSLSGAPPETVEVINEVELIRAVQDAKQGDTIRLAEGIYRLNESLVIKSGVNIVGAGIAKTVIKPNDIWMPSNESLPDPEIKWKGLDRSAWLLRIEDRANHVSISNLTLQGPQLHGAIFGFKNESLHIHDVCVKDFRWCGIRTFFTSQSKIYDREFVDAGGRWKRGGIPGVDGGISGGAIFVVWKTELYVTLALPESGACSGFTTKVILAR
ncbi:MAG: hypothetical protein AAF939_11375 [Planctomycetota bacterium]